MKVYYLNIFFICFAIAGCGGRVKVNGGEVGKDLVLQGFPLEFLNRDYLPNQHPSYLDSTYMEKVNNLLESEVEVYNYEAEFLRIVKSIAWIESSWQHYVYSDEDEYYIVVGDEGLSFGMFQIYSKDHGKHLEIVDNVTYAIGLIDQIYSSSDPSDCSSGSNYGHSQESKLRRIYATYNGWIKAKCRDGDYRDDRFVKIYDEQPWTEY